MKRKLRFILVILEILILISAYSIDVRAISEINIEKEIEEEQKIKVINSLTNEEKNEVHNDVVEEDKEISENQILNTENKGENINLSTENEEYIGNIELENEVENLDSIESTISEKENNDITKSQAIKKNSIIIDKPNITIGEIGENEKTEEDTKEESKEEKELEDQKEENKEPELTYKTHMQDIGWQSYVNNGEEAGKTGKALRMEALKIKLKSDMEGTIEYSTHVQNIGWQNYVSSGQETGTTGQSLRIEAIKIRLTGELAQKYDIYYRVHVQEKGWLAWTKNGEKAGTENFAYRMEAIQIKLVEKGVEIETSGKSFLAKPKLSYRTHIQNIGWQTWRTEGEPAGTEGRKLRLEAFKIKIENTNLSGNIKYSAHVQNIGWQNDVTANVLAGTQGKSLRCEAIKIELTGEIAEYFDIYYRVHSENLGWLAWAKNGEQAGSEGYSYRMEALQIQILPKEAGAPGNTNGHFYNKALETKTIEGIKLVLGNVSAGIDVSSHNGSINWNQVKEVADFAIIRCGYGQDILSQDDKKFEENMKECISNNIPVEVYLYSYADTTQKASSEADHIIRLCAKYKKYIKKIWYDVEDDSVFNQIGSGKMSKDSLEQIVNTFTRKVRANGYDAGVYTYINALNNYFNPSIKNNYEIWIANYPGKATDVFESRYNTYKKSYKMWQCTSEGIIKGITGLVDLNIKF